MKIEIEDALIFAEFFRDNFRYHDTTENGNVYKWRHHLKVQIPAMAMKEIFDHWQEIKRIRESSNIAPDLDYDDLPF